MNIFISFDMEGIAGIDRFSDEIKQTKRYSDAIHAHVRAVVEGIQHSSRNDEVEHITIVDSHGEGKNLDYLLLSEMDPRIELISGYPRKDFMMTAIEGHDIAFFLGYHAGSGHHHGNMNHSYSTHFHRVTVNDIKVSEAMINQIVAKDYDVPVGLVIGDSGLYGQLILEGYMPYVEYVVTKESLGHNAVRHKNFALLRREIVEKVDKVLSKDIMSLPLGDIYAPYRVVVETNRTLHADKVEIVPGISRLDGYRVGFTAETGTELIDTLMTLEAMCRV
ncbi:D-stereospecific aminopeptidase [Aedoeadaptatus nemausensis]|uniref:D-stereospecific aminopeptidase n=1 Tax=Aedoeadaptatus nemausensis TaxID=2582829 RepID=A0A6V6Y6X3_9FIRM|nr:M55 family metallopeptidase [Peptoniphilus nemausensis]CAC9935560.1 D-stereospecific aminopeptidase [Peptoniphilus nemausensis]